MASQGHYDQNLLAAAPKATKADLQEGYNVDLLDEGRRKPKSSTPPLSTGHADLENGKEIYTSSAAAPKSRFKLTQKTVILIVIAVVIIVGAVVGGVVGGTHKSHKNDNSSPPKDAFPTAKSGSSGVSSSSATQQVGPAAASQGSGGKSVPFAPQSSGAALPASGGDGGGGLGGGGGGEASPVAGGPAPTSST